MTSGGEMSSSGAYTIMSTTGQAGGVGVMTGGPYRIEAGFWPAAESPLSGVGPYEVSVQSNLATVTIEVVPDDICDSADWTTPFSLHYPNVTDVTLTAPIEHQFDIFLRWQINAVDQPGGQLAATLTADAAPTLAEALYFDPYQYVTEGYAQRTTAQPVTSAMMAARYTTPRFAGLPTVQAFYESHDLTADPVHLQEYIRLQTMLGNDKLVQIEDLPYLSVLQNNQPVPDLDAEEYAARMTTLAGGGVAELNKLLRYARFAQALADFDRQASVPFDQGAIRDLVYAFETLGRLSLKELQVFALKAGGETDLQRQQPNSAYQSLLAKGAVLNSRMAIAQGLTGNVLTAEEVNLCRLPALATIMEEADLLIRSVQARVVQTDWLASMGLDPREVQVWANYVPNPAITVEEAWNEANAETCNARTAWLLARDTARQYDQDQTQFAQHIAQLRERYLGQLDEMTGVDPTDFPDENNVPLGDSHAISAYLGHIFGQIDRPPTGNFPGPEDLQGSSTPSSLAEYIQHIREADAAITTAQQRITGISELARIEEDRADAVIAIVNRDTGRRITLEELITQYSSTSESTGVSVSYSDVDQGGGCRTFYLAQATDPCPAPDGWTCGGVRVYPPDGDPRQQSISCHCCAPTTNATAWLSSDLILPNFEQLGFGQSRGTSSNPNATELATARGDLVELQEAQRSEIEQVNSEATLNRLDVDLAAAQTELKQRVLEYEGAILAYRQVVHRLGILLDNYLAARQDLATAYFTNPAYRQQRDQAQTEAEQLLRRARLKSYQAVRRLEYAWAERYSDGGTSSPWDDAGSIFKANHPGDCTAFLRAVKDWDTYIRTRRTNQTETNHSRQEAISVRRHIMGFSDVYLSGFYEGQPLQSPPGSGIIDELGISANQAAWQDFVRDHLLTTMITQEIFGTPAQPALLITVPISVIRSVGDGNEDPPVVSQFVPNSWNQRIKGLDVNLVGDSSNLLIGGTTNTAFIGVIQRGSAVIQPAPNSGQNLILLDADPWEDFNFPFAYPNAFTFSGTVNQNINAPVTYHQPEAGSPLRERPISASEWTIYIPSDQGAGKRLNLQYLTDIEILFDYYYGGHQHTIATPPCP